MKAARLTRVLACLGTAAAATACASAPPIVDLEPVAAEAAELPLAWFAENWGPFEPSLGAPSSPGARGRPLVLFDGRQVPTLDRDALVPGGVEGFTDEDLAAIGVVLYGGEPPMAEAVRSIGIVRCRSGGPSPLGDAARDGAILIFSHDYAGPMPREGRVDHFPDCRVTVP